jgi:hypothetical protein
LAAHHAAVSLPTASLQAPDKGAAYSGCRGRLNAHANRKDRTMNATRLLATLMLAGLAGAASAQGVAQDVQRDVNQQTRIENGLKSGALTTREAAALEHQESRIDRMQARDLRDGSMSAQEQQRLTQAQNRVSRQISAATHNGATGDPSSASSQRMQQAVQRNVNQEQRIQNGVQSGQLTNREVARLERGQARVDRREARAGRDGHVGAAEAGAINRSENRQSARIHRQRHDRQARQG